MNDERSTTQRSQIRVFLFAEYRIVLDSIKHFIESNRDMLVTTCASPSHLDNPDIAEYSVESDVAVVFISDPTHIELVSVLLGHNPNIRVVVVAKGTDLESQANALKLGAVGIVHKDQNYKFLIEAIRQTYSGDTWLNQVLLHKILEKGKANGKKSANYLSEFDADALT